MLLVTGITGRSGAYFLKELVDHNYSDTIRCIVRPCSDTSLLDKSALRIEKAVGNLTDQEFTDICMNNVDTVLHIGTIFHSANVIRSAVTHNVRTAILVHTTGIYSKYKSASEDYKNIESEIEAIIKSNVSSIKLTILRPTMIYGNINDGNMVTFIKIVDKLRLCPLVIRGKSLIRPVHAQDLAIAYYRVLTMPDHLRRKEYILSGERPMQLIEALEMISGYLHKKTTFIGIPLSLGVFLARGVKGITLGKVDYVEKVQRMGEDRSFSHDDAANDFGFAPRPFTEGIKYEVEQYLQRRQ
jgi:nucleoside-diphosphate-sugar epimerase